MNINNPNNPMQVSPKASTHGRINSALVLGSYLPFMILTPFYCYYEAVKHHQEKPYPAATITQTACHYSQDIVCRFFMVIGSSILCMIYFIVFKWVENAQKKAGFPKKISNTLYWVAQFSILLYSITLGTIDDKGTGPLHSPCAVIFFLILIVSIVQITLYLTQLRAYDTRAISRNSLYLKQITMVYLIITWIYCIAGLILTSSEDELQLEGKGDKYVVIVQWNTVAVGLLWVLSWVIEWRHYGLTLKSVG